MDRSWFAHNHVRFGHTLAVQSRRLRGLEIVLLVEIGDQPVLHRLPPQLSLGPLTRGRRIECCEIREPADVRQP
jgi:hypothetical protein